MVEKAILWCPIQAEPKPGSGERVTVAVACVGPGTAWVRPLPDSWACDHPDLTVTLRVLRPLFKGLEAALRRHGEKALVGGARLSGTVLLGEVRRALPMDEERLAEMAFRATAVFGSRKAGMSAKISRAGESAPDDQAEQTERYDAIADLRRIVHDTLDVMKIATEDDPQQRAFLRAIIVKEDAA